MRVSNTNTAMGKALAAAMGGLELQQENTKAATAVMDKEEAMAGGLEKKVKDKKKLAEELGIGEITLTDILKELENVNLLY